MSDSRGSINSTEPVSGHSTNASVASSAPLQDSSASVWTVQRIVLWSTDFLSDKGTDTPRLDAELLLCSVLNCKRIQLYMNFDKPVTVAERDTYKMLLRRRANGEPIAYILGEKEFMGLSFTVTRDVLIPRPDTEILVETALAILQGRDSKVILDIGTGSGCIPISLAKLGQASGVAWDISETALVIACGNAKRHEVDAISFERSDALSDLSWSKPIASKMAFDLVVSNPPYIAHDEARELPVSVREYEPASALFAAESGLQFYRVIAKHARAVLKPDGKLMFEIGCTQAAAVAEILIKEAWTHIEIIKDLAGRDRVVVASPVRASEA